ncbi:hypothetical protein BG004_007807, partial [Podila humilis]
MPGLGKTYDPQHGPAFGQLTREAISTVVKSNINSNSSNSTDAVTWSIGQRRPK